MRDMRNAFISADKGNKEEEGRGVCVCVCACVCVCEGGGTALCVHFATSTKRPASPSGRGLRTAIGRLQAQQTLVAGSRAQKRRQPVQGHGSK